MSRAIDVYRDVSSEMSSARALPARAYLDDDVYEDEVDLVLKAGWLPIARTSEVARPGDYRAVDLLGESLVVTRDQNQKLHVLSRICRHRAMPIIEGKGTTKSLNCPYHLWRYGLDGKLLSAPAMEESAIFKAQECNLPTVRHEEWGGWIFANLSGTAGPLTEQLASLSDRLGAIDPSAMVTAATLEFESSWNWKVMVENFLESYHHIGPHADTLQQTHPGLSTRGADFDGLFTVLDNPPRSAEGDPFVVACVFPLTLMFFTEGEVPTGGWYEFNALEKDRFLLRIHLLAPPEIANDASTVEAMVDWVRGVHLEDIPVCEGVQSGLHSSLYRSGPLSHLEKCNWHFQRFLQRNVLDGAGA